MIEINGTVLLTAVVAPLLASVIFNITAVVKGWLIPKSTHDQQIKILADRILELITEKNEWRAAAQASEAVNREVRAQNSLLLEQGKTTVYALDEIRRGMVIANKAGEPL